MSAAAEMLKNMTEASAAKAAREAEPVTDRLDQIINLLEVLVEQSKPEAEKPPYMP